MAKPRLIEEQITSARIAESARRKHRSVYWSSTKERLDTPVFDGSQLVCGNTLKGPVLIETPHTTVVVHPGQTLSVDTWGNFALTFG
jgi:N-methylhydantoinase A/oxoprolinase/acetone carboxylase beta subunit